MNRIALRANIILVIAGLLLSGFGFFMAEYSMKAEEWIMTQGSPHIYDNKSDISTGVVVDREGILLLNLQDGRTYSSDSDIRISTVHWLGDRERNISSQILNTYANEMAGYNGFSGVYSYSGAGGIMELTLSTYVQKVALEAMGNYRGTVAVYNYKTGQLICAVSTPGLDPDNPPTVTEENQESYDSIYYHRFIQSVYIPGSIYKIVTLAAALEEIPDIQSQTFTCKGSYQIGDKTIVCDGTHWNQDLPTAFKNSCNCAFAQIAQQLGGETMAKYVAQFGLTDAISFDGFTTTPGNYSSDDEDNNGNDYEVAWSGVGQYKDQINPCTFLTFVGAIANGGVPAMPYVVDQITCDGSTTYSAETQVGGRIMSKETADLICQYMNANVEQKYGANNFPGLTVGAKTGTGEVGGGQKPNAMFTGFVLDDEYPLAFIVAVENGGYGRSVCMPIASEVLAACKEILDAS